MHRRHLRSSPLLALVLTGCFIDFGTVPAMTTASGGLETTTSTTTGGPPEDLGTSVASTDAATSTTTGVATTSGPVTTTADTSTGAVEPATTTGAMKDLTTSGGVEPFCGDGVVDPGEACDDGDQQDDDACRPDCTLPTCDDGVKNQDESDVDCGGACEPCDFCRLCGGNVDCVAGSFCTKGKCVASATVTVSLLKHCGPAMANWTVGTVMPPGTYRIIAEGGGGRVAKASGFGWRAACDGLDFGEMFVPFKLPSADAAFAALPVTQVDSAYPGGVLRCGIIDSLCTDNVGGAAFSVHLLCE